MENTAAILFQAPLQGTRGRGCRGREPQQQDVKHYPPCNVHAEWKPASRAARTLLRSGLPWSQSLERAAAPCRARKNRTRSLFIPNKPNSLPRLQKDLILFCLVIELFLKATYSQPGAAWPRRGRQLQPTAGMEAPELRPQSSQSPGRGSEEPATPNPTSDHRPALLTPDGETWDRNFSSSPSSRLWACSEHPRSGESVGWGGPSRCCLLPMWEHDRGWWRSQKYFTAQKNTR